MRQQVVCLVLLMGYLGLTESGVVLSSSEKLLRQLEQLKKKKLDDAPMSRSLDWISSLSQWITQTEAQVQTNEDNIEIQENQMGHVVTGIENHIQAFVNENCLHGFYNYPACDLACGCHEHGHAHPETCDDTGVCVCKAHHTGDKCDACENVGAAYDVFPHCHLCADGTNVETGCGV